MADSPILPNQTGWVDAQGRPLPVEFFRFFRAWTRYISQIDGNAVNISDILARLAALEAGGVSADIIGLLSVQVIGALSDGEVVLQLQGDQLSPGPESYYGTDELGAKGFHPLPPPAFVPYFIPADDEFIVPLYSQATFAMNIDVEGILNVEGYLIEVD